MIIRPFRTAYLVAILAFALIAFGWGAGLCAALASIDARWKGIGDDC